MGRAGTTSVCFLILAWLAVTASPGGILVWHSWPRPAPNHNKPVLYCTYFSGTGFFERAFLHNRSDQVGYRICPLWSRPIAIPIQ
ncbi:exported protein of unknown function [Candidatus Filomicrobium marinum]|uniref:Uncharacterized protein n=1 Tax=Candidatus Filomicrobium marinum TaxID=1608628 RepID=A0A0D6JGD7_9HYPH|nr:exported protein of unknown function [Candidatus Filomicrobium marinum]CPR19957.1 exported protein of unknown function [Candidatus Filomicrobium marinum]